MIILLTKANTDEEVI